MSDLQDSAEKQAEESGWLGAYRDLKAHGLNWKKAAFCAWFAAPKDARRPKTQEKLAKLLNYKSVQTFYVWRKKAWFRELGVDRLSESILTQHLADVNRAVIDAALTGNVHDRRLYFERLDRARPDVAEDESVLVWLKALRNTGPNEMADDVSESE